MLNVRPLFSVFDALYLLWRDSVVGRDRAVNPYVCSYCNYLWCFQFLGAFTTSILVRFVACYPTAIVRRVAEVVINSIQHQAIRAFAHVSEKIFKRLPSAANCNSTQDVVFGLWMRGFATSIDHVTPRRIGLCFPSSVCMAVFGMSHGRSVR